MAKSKPDTGLTPAELTEVQTLQALADREETPASPPGTLAWATPEDEIAYLEAEIVKAHARIVALQHPPIRYPKMVKGRIFATQAEHEAAGPEYAS